MPNDRLISSLRIESEQDIVWCRQRAKQLADWIGLPRLDQIRVATTVSELARNIYQYAKQGRFSFYMMTTAEGRLNGLRFEAQDNGAGIQNLDDILNGSYVSQTGMGVGLRGAQRLMDDFQIDTSSSGTRIRAAKYLSVPKPFPSEAELSRLLHQLTDKSALDPYKEMQLQSEDLLVTTSELRAKQQELEDTNKELEETNKGVVALYSELEKTAQELQDASEAKSRFFSNMTHEFRTPINIIENISKLLISGQDGPLNGEQYRQVKFISDAAAELSTLVNELLDLAEVQSGRMKVMAEPFSLNELLERIEAFAAALSFRYENISYRLDRLPEDVILNTDRERLFQILRNLISNAFKYTPKGSVTIRCFRPDDQQIEFMVADTGIGISEENQKKVFDEFYRIKSPGRKNIEGTGLGLSLAQKVATLLKGEIDLTSQEGVGSKFYLRIPIALEENASTLEQNALAGMTILLIDDSEADRYIVTRALESYAPIMIEADSAKASMDKLNAVRPDIIFRDLDLPDISGEELLESMDWSMHRRVLVNTAKALNDEELARLRPYCHAILQKSQPGYLEQLLCQVQSLSRSLRNE
ncbi:MULTISPECIES: ATP-binding response regulator [Pseudomonas]|uniref:histidine kinase n=1 Tax=Pseudomonas lutea TaxID=243924 RepID=A0A9X8MF85_9PSED|nr:MULTISPECIES: ATP-binding protein [Pseudomonas]SER03686.1 Signal transduction histidine kinase [Pseudomonas lutea]